MNIKIGDTVETIFYEGIVMDIVSGNLLLLVDTISHKSLGCVDSNQVINHTPKPNGVTYLFLQRIQRDHDKLTKKGRL